MFKRNSKNVVPKISDFLIIGGGIMGLNVAKSIYRRYPKAIVHILEKESAPGMHTSGRNSSVIHAGIYYSTTSLKAKFCKEGNRRLTQYCLENNLDIKRCGKFISATNQQEYERLHEIYSQGVANGIDIELMTRQSALKIEPALKGYGDDVIWSPTTSVANNKQVIQCLSNELNTKFGDYCTQFYGFKASDMIAEINADKTSVCTQEDLFETRYLINCAGQQSHEIAYVFGFGTKYTPLPVKGNYLISNRRMDEVRSLVYPVPMKDTYFLGVHSTVTPDGYVKIGPSATPAFSFENYKNLENVAVASLLKILGTYLKIGFSRQAGLIAALATQEIPKLSKSKIVESVRKIHDLDPNAFTEWYPSGIRAQLINKKTCKFVEDFKLEYDGYCMHVLNAISPGWTCASPFADHILGVISTKFRLE